MALELIVVTPYGEAFRGEVDRVVLPGAEGEFGVLENHERFLAPLSVGEVEVQTSEGPGWAAIGEGFADVNPTQVTVMVESCEIAPAIDIARAEHARERAEAGIQATDADAERDRFVEYEAALRRAINRISVAEHGRG